MIEADKIWEEIKDLPLKGLYGLDNQTVEDHVTRLGGASNQVYLKLRAPAVIVSLEEAILKQATINWKRDETTGEKHRVSTKKFSLEEAEGYVIIKRAEEDLKLKKYNPDVFISDSKYEVNSHEAMMTPKLTDEGSVVAGGDKALTEKGRFTIKGSLSSDSED